MEDILDTCDNDESLAAISFTKSELNKIFDCDCCDSIICKEIIERDLDYELVIKCSSKYDQISLHSQLVNNGYRCEVRVI